MAVAIDPQLPIARISLELWHGMIEAGLLEGERVELIDGMMVEMNPPSPEHADVVQVLARALYRAALDTGLDVRVQQPLFHEGSGSEPQPDLAVVRADAADRHRHPATAEFVVEVALSSHRLDRGAKATLYAQAAVPEYWIVDVPGRVIERLTVPLDGRYAESSRHAAGESLAPAALPAAVVAIGELLPATSSPPQS